MDAPASPCLGTILASSCQPSSSPPPSSGSIAAVWSHLSTRSTTAPTLFCGVAPALSFTIRVGHETRSLPSAASRPAGQWTPSLVAHIIAADRRVLARAGLPQPSGSRFQTCWFLRRSLQRHHKMVPEPFSYPARRFLHPQDWRRLYSLPRCCTRPVNGQRQRGWTSDLFSSQPRPELRWSPVESCLHPW